MVGLSRVRIRKVTFLAEVMWGIVRDAIPFAFYHYILIEFYVFLNRKKDISVVLGSE